MWHPFMYHDSSYVWDLVLAHLVIEFAPGSLKPGCEEVVSEEYWLYDET
jgi:hypothetical protein